MFFVHFLKISKRCHALNEEAKRWLPKIASTRLNSSCRLGQAVHRDTLENFLQNTVDNSDDRDTGTGLPCCGFLASLQDFEFIFVLSVLNELFSTADTVWNIAKEGYGYKLLPTESAGI